jgi:drug/metabolite transporter (DMT)-like permease
VAILASACFECGYVLQALEARSVSTRASDRAAGTLASLVIRRRWLGGLALSGAGALLQVLALRLVPLTVVQPALALGVVAFVVVGGPLFGERVGPAAVAAAALAAAGVAVLAVAASDLHQGPTSTVAAAVILGTLAAIVVVAFAARGAAPALLVAGAGAGDALAALAAERLAHGTVSGAWLLAAAWLAVAALAVVASLSVEMRALTRWAATRVGPIVLVCQTVVPVLAAPVVAGERWGDRTAVILAALAVVAVAAAVLARSAPLPSPQP